MNTQVLVAYSSKYGATAGIAEKIGEALSEAGLAVDVLTVKDVKDIADYDAVVLGSAVYIGRWRRDAVKFLKSNQNMLTEKPVWFFSSGPIGEGDPVELLEGWEFPPPQQELADRIQPRDIAVFHGAIEEAKLNGIERWMMNNFDTKYGDFRDWDSITEWAKSIAGALKNQPDPA